MFANVEENFYELYKDEKESIIVLKECEMEDDDDNQSVGSFESEDFDDEVEENVENSKNPTERNDKRRDSSKSKASTAYDEDEQIQYKITKKESYSF